MKSILGILAVVVLIGVTSGCNVVDDAARVVPSVVDDAARVVPSVIDDAARAKWDRLTAGVRTQLSRVSGWVDEIPADKKKQLEDTLVTTTCWYLTSAFEGRVPTDQELSGHISSKIAGFFSEDFEQVLEVVVNSAQSASKNLQSSEVDRKTLADWCNNLPD